MEIKELDDFIWYAERVWNGKLVQQTQKYILKTVPCSMFEESEYVLNTDTKDKILVILFVELIEFIEYKINNINW